MHALKVGDLYVPNRKLWPQHVEYNWRGAHELRLFYKSPTPKEIEDHKKGVAQFAIYPYMNLLFFCWRFGDQPWADGVYHYHLVPSNQRVLPPDPNNADERGLLTVILVNSDNGIIEALRVCSFSPTFTRALHAVIWKQAESAPLSNAVIDRMGNRIYGQYSSSQIAQKLAIAKCKAGEE